MHFHNAHAEQLRLLPCRYNWRDPCGCPEPVAVYHGNIDQRHRVQTHETISYTFHELFTHCKPHKPHKNGYQCTRIHSMTTCRRCMIQVL